MIKEVTKAPEPVPVEHASSSLGVSRSGYYKWNSHDEKNNPNDDEQLLKDEIHHIVIEFTGYGYRRVTHELRRRGFTVNHKRVLRIMKEENLIRKKRRFKPQTTDSDHEHKVHPNLIEDLEISRPNQVWASDITYVRLVKGFVYLAVIIDIFTRRCIGWELDHHIDTRLTLNALHHALENRKGTEREGLIHHSDQGVQYASREYIECLQEHGILISMSRKGNPYENAYAESFFKTIKTEEVYMNEYETYQDALENIGPFIEDIYNRKRLHSALGYMPPMEFEQEVGLNIEA